MITAPGTVCFLLYSLDLADQNTLPPPATSPLLQWRAPVVPHHERSARWYTIGAALVIAGAAWGIVTGNWSFALVILLLGATYYLIRNEPPLERTITVTDQGFQLKDRFTPWSDCRDFWLIYTPQYTELRIGSNQRLRADAVIQTGDANPALIRQTLLQFLPERPNQHEHLIDRLLRTLQL